MKWNQAFAGLVAVVAVVSLSTITRAADLTDADGMFKIGSVEIKKIDQYDSPMRAEDFLSGVNDCSSVAGNKPLTLDGVLPDINLSTIINLGQKLWSFIEANKAVANLKTQSANALPAGLKCWSQLSNWHAPRSEVYQVSYKNLFGYEVVNLQFALVYSWGGQLHGQGAYLTNSTVQYRNLDVAWGWQVNANVEVPMVTNLGTESSPVAGMQVDVHWKVDALSHSESTASFFVSGDGRPTQQL